MYKRRAETVGIDRALTSTDTCFLIFSLDLKTLVNSMFVKQKLLKMWDRQCVEGLKGRSGHIPHQKQLLDFCIYSWIQYELSLGF